MSTVRPSTSSKGSLRPQPALARPRLLLATTILASSLAFIDGSVVNVGLPAMGRSLAAGASDLPWVINAYLLPLSALLLLGGAAGDRFGRRGLLMGGTAVFAAASLACALAPSLPWLVAGRFAQGVGAAMLMPNSLAILGASFEATARGRAIGLWAATGAMMSAGGPVLGGWLIDGLGWRPIFVVNLPLAVAAIVLARISIPDQPRNTHAPLDATGAVLATVALAAFTWGLTVGASPSGWAGPPLGAVGIGLVLLGAFVLIERQKGDRAMMPLALFGSRAFVGLTVLTLSLYGALGVLSVTVPYLLIANAGYPATAAGAALLPLPLVLAAASPTMGILASRVGPRLPLTTGTVVVAGGFMLLLRIGPEARYWAEVFPALLVIAIGLAAAVAPLTTAVLGSTAPSHAGAASGFNSTVARAGGLIATALLGGVLGASGAPLLASFHAAALLSAAACLVAAVSAFVLV